MAKLLYSLLLATVYFSIEGAVVSGPKHERIVGGSRAEPGQFPYVAKIQKQGKNITHHCGGVIINRNWVLTVAHCVNQKQKYEIQAGIINGTQPNPNQQNQTVRQIILHPNYTRVSLNFSPKHDFALLKVDGFKFNDFLKPVQLPKPGTKPKNATVVGWSAVAANKTQSIMKYLNVTVPKDQKSCGDHYSEFNPVNHFCSSPPDIKPEDACVVDDGALLVHNNTLYGVVLVTDHPCDKRPPPIYANITDAIIFINKTIRA